MASYISTKYESPITYVIHHNIIPLLTQFLLCYIYRSEEAFKTSIKNHTSISAMSGNIKIVRTSSIDYVISYSNPLSVSKVASKFRIFPSKNGCVKAGSISGSSPISFENHSKPISRSDGYAGFSARQYQI
jgi:hypothetical protein